ncbi:MAG TPA: hypothetical protein VH280_18165 [Verrucomicrobiae bacterium]|jgi:hypothetical protein|nr:hypothetical protein [Verrucomicrobiae bacterium]
MRSFPILFATLCAALPLAVKAQSTTNAPATEIENFELQTDAVIVKGISQIGTLATDEGTILVRCKESANETSGQKQYAIGITIENNQSRIALQIDYDELDALIHGLDFLSKTTSDVTTMPAFDAAIRTRSGFRAGAHSERRQGSIELFVQFPETGRLPLTADQFRQLQNLITQAKTELDTARSKN